MKRMLAIFALLATGALVAIVWPAHAQNYTNGVVVLQVTIGAGTNTQITTADTPCLELFLQNNAAHNMRVGGPGTTSSKGAQLNTSAGGGGGSITSNGFGFRGTNVNQWFVAGTNGDVLDAICMQ